MMDGFSLETAENLFTRTKELPEDVYHTRIHASFRPTPDHSCLFESILSLAERLGNIGQSIPGVDFEIPGSGNNAIGFCDIVTP